MNPLDWLGGAIVGVILTALAGLVWTILARPNLQIVTHEENPRAKQFLHHTRILTTISGTLTGSLTDAVQQTQEPFWIVQVKVINRSRRWSLLDKIARRCTGVVEFTDENGNWTSSEPMTMRWDQRVEPIIPTTQGPLYHAPTAQQYRSADIAPGEAGIGDIAFRVERDSNAYGWSDDSYLQDNAFDPRWRLPPGRNRVRVTITSVEDRNVHCQREFLLINEGTPQQLTLRTLT